MLGKSPLQATMDTLLERKGIIWLTGSQPENRDKYAEILFRARPAGGTGPGSHINLVCGELSPLLFNDERVIRALDWGLDQGAQIRIIFHRTGSPEDVSKSLQRTNPKLCGLLGKNPQKITLYLSPIRLQQHFMAISDLGVLFEKPETDTSKRDWWAIYVKDGNLAKEWCTRFDRYITEGRLQAISPPPPVEAASLA